MNRLKITSLLACLLACFISISAVAAESADSDPYTLITPLSDASAAEASGIQAVSNPGLGAIWFSDEIWLILSVVIAVIGITIMRKTMN